METKDWKWPAVEGSSAVLEISGPLRSLRWLLFDALLSVKATIADLEHIQQNVDEVSFQQHGDSDVLFRCSERNELEQK